MRPLLKLLAAKSINHERLCYGFNDGLQRHFNGARVFACPLPGVGGVTSEEIDADMRELKDAILQLRVRLQLF